MSWKQNDAQTSVIETVALIVVIILVFWFFVRPQSTILGTEKTTLQQAQAEYAQVDQDKQKLAELTARLKKSQADIVLVDEALPLNNRPTQVEYLLSELVAASGMTLTDINIATAESNVVAGNKVLLKDPYAVTRKLQTTSLNLGVSGDIDQFRNLLQLIESNSRIIDVSTLDMTNDAESPVFKLQLKVYSYVP